MRALHFITLVLGAAAAAGASPFPSVELTRHLDASGIVESLVLSCAKDIAGKEEYICQVARHHNGAEVSSAAVPSKEVKILLQNFFRRLPKKTVASLSPSREKASAGDQPLLSWKVQYGNQNAEGTLWHSSTTKKRDSAADGVTRVVLSLEAVLSAQLLK